MKTTITLAEAREQLREAEQQYRNIEKALAETTPGTPTAEVWSAMYRANYMMQHNG